MTRLSSRNWGIGRSSNGISAGWSCLRFLSVLLALCNPLRTSILSIVQWYTFTEPADRAVLLFSIPYGGPAAMIWGVRSIPVLWHKWRNLTRSHQILVADVLLFPHHCCACHGRTWVGCTNCWRLVLLDIPILVTQIPKIAIMACRL